MKPVARNEDRVPRGKLGLLRAFQGGGETRIALEVGRRHMDHADRRAGRRRMRRAHVEIGFGFRREQRESAPPRSDHGKIIDWVVVRSDLCGIADPQAGLGRCRDEWHGMGLSEARDEALSDQSLRNHCIWPLCAFLIAKAGDEPGKITFAANEVQRLAVAAVVKAALFLRVGAEHFGEGVTGARREDCHAAVWIRACGNNQLPFARNSAQNYRLPVRNDFPQELLRRGAGPVGDFVQSLSW